MQFHMSTITSCHRILRQLLLHLPKYLMEYQQSCAWLFVPRTFIHALLKLILLSLSMSARLFPLTLWILCWNWFKCLCVFQFNLLSWTMSVVPSWFCWHCICVGLRMLGKNFHTLQKQYVSWCIMAACVCYYEALGSLSLCQGACGILLPVEENWKIWCFCSVGKDGEEKVYFAFWLDVRFFPFCLHSCLFVCLFVQMWLHGRFLRAPRWRFGWYALWHYNS